MTLWIGSGAVLKSSGQRQLKELFTFAIFDFVYTLASANIDQSVPNLATIYKPIVSDECDYGSN